MEKGIEVLGSEHAQKAAVLCGPGELLPTKLEISRSDKDAGRMTISYPIDFGKTLNVAAFQFGYKEWPHEKWIVPANHEELTKSFEGRGKTGPRSTEGISPMPPYNIATTLTTP